VPKLPDTVNEVPKLLTSQEIEYQAKTFPNKPAHTVVAFTPIAIQRVCSLKIDIFYLHRRFSRVQIDGENWRGQKTSSRDWGGGR
jgi:hypothetical protein